MDLKDNLDMYSPANLKPEGISSTGEFDGIGYASNTSISCIIKGRLHSGIQPIFWRTYSKSNLHHENSCFSVVIMQQGTVFSLIVFFLKSQHYC